MKKTAFFAIFALVWSIFVIGCGEGAKDKRPIRPFNGGGISTQNKLNDMKDMFSLMTGKGTVWEACGPSDDTSVKAVHHRLEFVDVDDIKHTQTPAQDEKCENLDASSKEELDAKYSKYDQNAVKLNDGQYMVFMEYPSDAMIVRLSLNNDNTMTMDEFQEKALTDDQKQKGIKTQLDTKVLESTKFKSVTP